MKRIRTGGITTALVSAAAIVAAPVGLTPATAAPAHPTTKLSTGQPNQIHRPALKRTDGDAKAAARQAARALVARRPAKLKAGPHDAFRAGAVITSSGLQYVPYSRTFRGLPVVGGDFVVATNRAGRVLTTSVAQHSRVRLSSIKPTLTRAAARRVTGRQVRQPQLESTRLVVLQRGGSQLAYQTTVRGLSRTEHAPSRLTVMVSARTGKVLATTEHVMEGTGNGNWEGQVSIPTSGSGSSYSMTDTNATTLKCQNASGNQTFTGSDNVWGTGSATDRETGCVDAFYSAEQERLMLSSWLGRNGMTGTGGWVPIRVGLNDVNAYYDGTQVQVGHTQAGGKWIGSIDVVAHEFGHGIDDHTPGGISGKGTQEFVADTFGAATEWFANNPADAPDFTVGEEVNLVGSGPIRYMYKPSLAGDDDCYSSSTPTDEVHAAAGPGNHWFYLLAEGSSPSDGQPASPTCNGSSVTGLGITKAIKIMYNAMLIKTTGASYLKYRTWTLTAAKNLYPGSCTEFNAVKAAWDAVSVPAQSADPTCGTGGGTDPGDPGDPGTGDCSGQLLGNAGFETGSAAPWSASSGVVDNSASPAAHSGSWKAWFDGYGSTHTDTVSQSVTIPAGCTATLTFYLWISTDETTTGSAYDKFTVRAGSTTMATYSNLNAGSGYVKRSINLSSQAGKTVSIGFTGTEDVSLATSFILDDVALNLG